MANNKVGLDYFELDCQMEEKVRLIQAEFGLKGFAVVVKLYQKIYGEFGYYCEWSEDSLLLFMSENGVPSDSKNLIQEIVSACVRRNIFSEKLFKKFGILTSSGVQKRYMNATSRREKVSMKKEYLLLNDGKINPNVDIIEDSADIIKDNVYRNKQSRVEKSREENIPPISPLRCFEDFVTAYPKAVRNRHAVEIAYNKLLLDDVHLTESDLITAVKNYAESVSILGTEERYMKNPENFLKDNFFAEYMEDNYIKPKPPNKHSNANQGMIRQDYGDLTQLEKELLGN